MGCPLENVLYVGIGAAVGIGAPPQLAASTRPGRKLVDGLGKILSGALADLDRCHGSGTYRRIVFRLGPPGRPLSIAT